MSLIALLSLSSSSASSSRSPSSPARSSKFADLSQRIPFHPKVRRNSQSGGAGALKPQQQLQLKLYGTNKKSRYRSLLAGFSVDVVERFDRLLAPYSSMSSSIASHPGLLAASDGLYAPQTNLSLFMDSLHFLPQTAMASSWRTKKPTMLATSAVNDSSSNSTSSSAEKPPMDRQIELVAFPRRRSVSRSASPKTSKATTTVVIPSRARRSSISNSRSPTSRHSRQSELRRAIRANAQLSSVLMNKKMLLNETAPPTAIPNSMASEISYEINEQELANRFYIELKSHDSRETASNASGVSTPRLETKMVQFAEDEDHTDPSEPDIKEREDEWRAKQLDLERQVAALIAENQTKTALIRYLMDENSRIVGDCECGHTVKATISVETPEDEEEIHHHHHHSNNNNDSCASSGRAQQQQQESGSGEQQQLAVNETGATVGKSEPESPASSPQSSPRKAAQVSSIEVQVAKRKLLETEPHFEQNQQIRTQNQKPAAHEVLFEGLVSEIAAEFSQLFACESSA